jgi:coenzyme F420-dependent glucose-6-phosphate dehydrogenase
VAQLITTDAVAEKVVCGPGEDPILEKIGTFVDAGFDHVFLHQVGPRQDEFLKFAWEELLPQLDR